MGAAEETLDGVEDVSGEGLVEAEADEADLAAGVEELGEGAVVEDDVEVGRESDDAVGDGFDEGFELGAALLEGSVELGELRGGLFGECARGLEVGGHGVEANGEFAKLFGGGGRDAAGVVTGGDGFHGLGEGFDGACDLLGKVECEPAAGEERDAGDEEQIEHVERPDLAALAEEDPVGVGGGAESFGKWSLDGGALDGRVGLRVRVRGVVGRKQGAEFGGPGVGGQMQKGDGVALAVDDGEAALEGELVAREDTIDSGEIRVRSGEVEAGELDGDGFGLGAGVGGGVAEELEGGAVGVVAHLGDGLREPAVDGAVHQQVAEGEHEAERNERDQDGSPEHAGAKAGAEDATALVGVELEEVADEQNEDDDEENKGERGESDEDQRLKRGRGVEEVDVEGVKGGEEDEEQKAHAQTSEELAACGASAHARKFTRWSQWLVVSG